MSVHVDEEPTPPSTDAAPKRETPARNGLGWTRFLARIFFVSFRPKAFWTKLRAEGPIPSTMELLWPHTVLLTAMVGVATAVGDIIHERAFDIIVLHALLAFVGAFLLVVGFALIARAAVVNRGAGINLHEAFAFSVYGLTPVLLLGVLNVIPVAWLSTVIGMVALPYSFYVLAVGVPSFLQVPDVSGAEVTGKITAGLLLLWGLTTAFTAMAIL